jgi:hypothetical protein
MSCDQKCRIIHRLPRFVAEMVNNSADFEQTPTTQVATQQRLRSFAQAPDGSNYSPRSRPGRRINRWVPNTRLNDVTLSRPACRSKIRRAFSIPVARRETWAGVL